MRKTIVSSSRIYLILVLVTVLLALAACGSKSKSSPTPPITSTPTPAPGITITSPTGNIFGIGSVAVSVQVSNFNLVDKLGQPNTAGQGHIHYFMDVDPPTTPGQPAVTNAGTYAATVATTYTWPNVGSGQHKFAVELVNNDHTPLIPPVISVVNVPVIPEIGPSSVVITSPRDGSILPAGDVTVSVQATNFNVVDKLGQPNVEREGHIHYFMDVDAPTTPGQPAVTTPGTYAATSATSYTWTNVAAGTHTFSVELVNNDHTPLTPPVVAQVMVTVQSAAPTPTSIPIVSTTIDLVAQNLAFNKRSITVPAGASITINFNNKDTGILHNFAVYQNLSTGQTKPVFVGDIITGPATTTYHFTAPAASGSYFFVCDVHPQMMNGQFIVTP